MELREIIFWIMFFGGWLFVIEMIFQDTRKAEREKERVMMIYVNGTPRDINVHETIMTKANSVALDIYKRPYDRLSISLQHKVYTDAQSLVVDDLRENRI